MSTRVEGDSDAPRFASHSRAPGDLQNSDESAPSGWHRTAAAALDGGQDRVTYRRHSKRRNGVDRVVYRGIIVVSVLRIHDDELPLSTRAIA